MACMLIFYKLAPCTKLSVLKLSQGISNKLGQRRSLAFMLDVSLLWS